jgi:hypothetical protein
MSLKIQTMLGKITSIFNNIEKYAIEKDNLTLLLNEFINLQSCNSRESHDACNSCVSTVLMNLHAKCGLDIMKYVDYINFDDVNVYSDLNLVKKFKQKCPEKLNPFILESLWIDIPPASLKHYNPKHRSFKIVTSDGNFHHDFTMNVSQIREDFRKCNFVCIMPGSDFMPILMLMTEVTYVPDSAYVYVRDGGLKVVTTDPNWNFVPDTHELLFTMFYKKFIKD